MTGVADDLGRNRDRQAGADRAEGDRPRPRRADRLAGEGVRGLPRRHQAEQPEPRHGRLDDQPRHRRHRHRSSNPSDSGKDWGKLSEPRARPHPPVDVRRASRPSTARCSNATTAASPRRRPAKRRRRDEGEGGRRRRRSPERADRPESTSSSEPDAPRPGTRTLADPTAAVSPDSGDGPLGAAAAARSRTCDARRGSALGRPRRRATSASTPGRSTPRSSTRRRSTPRLTARRRRSSAKTTACTSRSAPARPRPAGRRRRRSRSAATSRSRPTSSIRKLPKPAQEDGAAVGLAIAIQNIDQPDATLVRLIEPDGADVYRADREGGNRPAAHDATSTMMFDAVRQQPMGQARQAAAAHVPGRGRRRSASSSGARGRPSATRSSTRVRHSPAYLGQVDARAERRRGREAVRLQPQRRRGGRRRPPRPDDPRRPDHRPGDRGPHRLRRGRPRRPDRDRGRQADRRRPAPAAPPPAPAGPAAAPAAARPAPRLRRQAGTSPSRAGRRRVPAPTGSAAAAAAAAAGSQPPTMPAKPRRPAAKAGRGRRQRSRQATPKRRARRKPAPPPKPPEPKARSRSTRSRASRSSGRRPWPAASSASRTSTSPCPAAEPARGRRRSRSPSTPTTSYAPPPGTVGRRQGPQGRAQAERHPRPAPGPLRTCSDAAIKQVTVNGQTDKGPTAWRLDTVGLPGLAAGAPPGGHRVVGRPVPRAARRATASRRTSPSTSPTRTARTATPTSRPTNTTDPKLAFDPKAAGPALDARVYLTGDEQLFGKLESHRRGVAAA